MEILGQNKLIYKLLATTFVLALPSVGDAAALDLEEQLPSEKITVTTTYDNGEKTTSTIVLPDEDKDTIAGKTSSILHSGDTSAQEEEEAYATTDQDIKEAVTDAGSGIKGGLHHAKEAIDHLTEILNEKFHQATSSSDSTTDEGEGVPCQAKYMDKKPSEKRSHQATSSFDSTADEGEPEVHQSRETEQNPSSSFIEEEVKATEEEETLSSKVDSPGDFPGDLVTEKAESVGEALVDVAETVGGAMTEAGRVVEHAVNPEEGDEGEGSSSAPKYNAEL